MSFLHTYMTLVIEILPHVRHELTYPNIVNVMGADIVVTQAAKASGTIILS